MKKKALNVVLTLLMISSLLLHVTIGEKYIYSSGDAVVGATLQIIDADGNVVKEWVTDGTTMQINAELEAGKTYTLHEVEAPDGLLRAADITFTVPADGSLESVTMYDEVEPDEPEPPTGDTMSWVTLAVAIITAILLIVTNCWRRKIEE